MKILIISDTHGRHIYLDRVIQKISPIDLVIHLGDFEGGEDYIEALVPAQLEMVSGNNDYFTKYEREKIITIGKYKILLTHGHRYRVHYGIETIKEIARQNSVDIVMFGHTHKPLIDLSDSIIVINPGSISQPRQEGGMPTYIIMEVDNYGEAHFALNHVK
jgi:uncharacterized protein